jgi:hypothetical protein
VFGVCCVGQGGSIGWIGQSVPYRTGGAQVHASTEATQSNQHALRFILTSIQSTPSQSQPVWRQWTVGDVIQVLNGNAKPSSVLESNPPELAWYDDGSVCL